jgi:hypothetical protein
MRRATCTPRNATSPPDRFFERELAGEEPPSLSTIRSLYQDACELQARKPWETMLETQLVVVEDPGSNQMCFCSILGSLGEVFCLHVHLGEEGYGGYLKLQSGEMHTAGDFLAVQRSVYLEFERLSRLTAPDRALLRQLGDPLKRGRLAPIFRSIRPGYHAWYVTEAEARTLDHCVRAVTQVWDRFRQDPEAGYWRGSNRYPLVAGAEIRLAALPQPALPMPRVPQVDKRRLEKIRNSQFRPLKVLQLDHFYGAATIGQPHERKALFRVAMAIDGETAFAFPPEAGSPEEPTGDLLARVFLQAMEIGRIVPREVQVRKPELQVLLEGLGRELGIPVRVKPSLPALDFAKSELLRMMGDAMLPDNF